MKTIRMVSAAFCIGLFLTSLAHSGILGDVNNDGKIGFPEAINALQVLSGVQTTLPANFVIRWRGDWASGQSYQKYDAVHYNGSSYIAILTHHSSAANDPTHVSTWNLMAEKGLQGPPGSLNPNISMDEAKYKTAVGMYSLLSNTGERNTAVGHAALHANSTGYRNTAVGTGALNLNTLGDGNTAIGNAALNKNTASGNTAVGNEALTANTIAGGNTAIGEKALYSNTDGSGNTATGRYALRDNTGGGDNTAIGELALMKNTTGRTNTATGGAALYSNTDGSYNTATGFSALDSNTNGYANTASGSGALSSNTQGNYNTAGGSGALATNTTGNYNTAIGALAGRYLPGSFTGSYNIYLGYEVLPASADESNTIRIGNNNQTRTFITSIYGVTITGANAVYVRSDGRLGTLTSSRRYKEGIADMGDASRGLMQLRPVSFYYKPEYSDGPRTLQYGLIAEEVAEVYPDLVLYDPKTGEPQTVSYHLINAMLLNEVQKQYKENQDQQRRIDDLEKRLAKLEAMPGE